MNNTTNLFIQIKDAFIKAILAGIAIGVGGITYLSVDNKYIGAFLFSLGLFTIVRFGFVLYTGKVGYVPEKDLKYIPTTVVPALIGNICGTGLTALLIRLTRFGNDIQEKASASMQIKMGDTLSSQLILAMFCGMLMYIAVENNAKARSESADFSAVFGVAIPVMVFILCGFNHSIADCFYMFVSEPSIKGILYVLIIATGNAIGGMIIPLSKKINKRG